MPDMVDTMAFVGEVPWHSLGNAVRAGATIDEMRVASGLTWEPRKHPLVYQTADGGTPVPAAAWDQLLSDVANRKIGREAARQQLEALLTRVAGGVFQGTDQSILVRSDTGAVLTHVGPDYEPILNGEIFEFFRKYAEIGGLQLETAGSLSGGRYVWCLASVGKSFKLDGEDEVKHYMLLANPHIYGKGARAKPTDVRVVCWNTFSAALRDGEEAVRIWHNAKFDAERIEKIHRQLAEAHTQFDHMYEMADVLSKTRLENPDARSIVLDTLACPRHALDETLEGFEKTAPRNAKRLMDLYGGQAMGATLASSQGTGWGLLNAVTQFVDHERGKNDDSRMLVSWFGQGEVMKQKAAELLLLEAGQPQLAKQILLKERVGR